MTERTNYVKLWEKMQQEADDMGYGNTLRAMGPSSKLNDNDIGID